MTLPSGSDLPLLGRWAARSRPHPAAHRPRGDLHVCVPAREGLPARAIAHAFDRCFSPGVTGGGWSPDDLWSSDAWTAVGLVVATRRFRAEAAAPDRPRPRRALRRVSAGS